MTPDVPLAAAIRWTRFGRVAVTMPLLGALSLMSVPTNVAAQSSPASEVYLGFDRNDYPGDGNLKALAQQPSGSAFKFMGR